MFDKQRNSYTVARFLSRGFVNVETTSTAWLILDDLQKVSDVCDAVIVC